VRHAYRGLRAPARRGIWRPGVGHRRSGPGCDSAGGALAPALSTPRCPPPAPASLTGCFASGAGSRAGSVRAASRRFSFRSIFEGLPLLRLKPAPKLIFEVNGLPSIELKYHYPGAADDRDLKPEATLPGAGLPERGQPGGDSQRRHRGLPGFPARGGPGKIVVIPNGVDLSVFRFQTPARSNDCFRLLYFGTLAPWQGVDLTIRALAQVCQQAPAVLTIIERAATEGPAHCAISRRSSVLAASSACWRP